MIKVLWFSVVFKNKILSDPKELMVGKGGFEPPFQYFLHSNIRYLQAFKF
jgi:hypothetical protein